MIKTIRMRDIVCDTPTVWQAISNSFMSDVLTETNERNEQIGVTISVTGPTGMVKRKIKTHKRKICNNLCTENSCSLSISIHIQFWRINMKTYFRILFINRRTIAIATDKVER